MTTTAPARHSLGATSTAHTSFGTRIPGAAPLPPTNQTAANGVRFGSLLVIEARKLFDTRAALWLLVATVALSAFILGSFAIFASTPGVGLPPLTGSVLLDAGTSSLHLLVPVTAIMVAASEWTQRSALVTFTVEPRRVRVLAAKVIAVIVASLVLFAIVAGLSVLVGWLMITFGHVAITWTFNAAAIAWLAGAVVLDALLGLALGMLLMNTPAAITVYFVAPMLMQLASGFSEKVAEVISWLNMSMALSPLTSGQWDHAHWGKVSVAISVWVLLPLLAGAVRMVRREVK